MRSEPIPDPLPAAEWDRLYKLSRNLRRTLRQRPDAGTTAELAEVKAAIRKHCVLSDPLAPFGGIPLDWRHPDRLGFIDLIGKTFRASQAVRRRWIYFSLVCNAVLLTVGLANCRRQQGAN